LKLTEDNFELHWNPQTDESYIKIVGIDSIQRDSVVKQIISNQEKAEKWDLFLLKGSTSEQFLKQENERLKETLEKIRYRVNQFRIEDGMIQDRFAYGALKELLATKEGESH